MFNLPTEPQGIGRTIDNGFKLFFASFKGVIVLAVIASILGSIPNLMMSPAMGGDPALMAMGPAAWGGEIIIAIIIAGLFSIILMAAIIAKMGATAQGNSISIGAALGRGLKAFLPVFLGAILYTLLVLIGSVLLVIPGIILMLSLAFYTYSIILDNHGPISALKDSHRLVWGNWWRTAGVFTVALIIVMVIYFGLGIPVGIIAAMTAGTEGDPTNILLVIELLSIVISSVVTPLFYALAIVIYHDLKTRKGGEDLAARIETATA